MCKMIKLISLSIWDNAGVSKQVLKMNKMHRTIVTIRTIIRGLFMVQGCQLSSPKVHKHKTKQFEPS